MARLCGFEVDAVIIDLDGTLVDTLGDFCLALNAMLADLPPPLSGQTVTAAQVRRWVGQGSAHLIRCVLNEVRARPAADVMRAGVVAPSGAGSGNADEEAAAWLSYQRHYRAINGQQAVVYPGAESSLRQLQALGLALACLTNKPTEFAQQLLRDKGLAPYFSLLFGGDSFAAKKPDPLPVRRTCEALGSAPHRTLVIGDSSNDARAARAAGCPVLLLGHGYNHGEPVTAVAADAYAEGWAGLWQG